MRGLLLSVIAATAASTCPALADTPIPIYSVDRACARWISPEMPNGASICVEMEQNLYDGLKLVWPTTPEYVRTYCVQHSDPSSLTANVGFLTGQMPPLTYQAISECVRPEARDAVPHASDRNFTP